MRTLILLAACGFAPWSFAAESWWKGAKPQAASKADIQDLVFCSESGLHKIRLHIQVNGRSASASWGGFLDKAWKFTDRDGDGWLSAEEVRRMILPSAYLQGFNAIFNGGVQAVNFAELDTNKDGKINRDEFNAYFRRSGLGAIQVAVLPPDRSVEELTSAFIKRVGRSGDGKLTRSDLAVAWERLAVLDLDEDEIVTSQELLERQPNPYGYQQFEAIEYPGMRTAPPNPTGAFLSLIPSDSPSASAAKIAQWLKASKQPLLAFATFASNTRAPSFVRASFNKLETELLVAWLAEPPELELNVTMGTISDGISRLVNRTADPGVRVKATGRSHVLEKSTAFGADGRLRLTLPTEIVEFSRSPSQGNDGNTTYYRQLFNMEAGAKKYMTKQELQQSQQLPYLANIFEQADRDADGKLFVAEFNSYAELLTEGGSGQLSIQVVDQGRGLFDRIDANRDRRMSRRELSDALKNFAALDRNGNDVLEREDLPRQFRVTIGQGAGNGAQFAVATIDAEGMGMSVTRPGPSRGPAWFRKMDRNRDGDVSLREFLGTPKEFKKIDADNDGLISTTEAENFDKARKK